MRSTGGDDCVPQDDEAAGPLGAPAATLLLRLARGEEDEEEEGGGDVVFSEEDPGLLARMLEEGLAGRPESWLSKEAEMPTLPCKMYNDQELWVKICDY